MPSKPDGELTLTQHPRRKEGTDSETMSSDLPTRTGPTRTDNKEGRRAERGFTEQVPGPMVMPDVYGRSPVVPVFRKWGQDPQSKLAKESSHRGVLWV